MNPRLARLLTRLYPRSWRERYGEEFAAFLETGPSTPRAVLNTLIAAIRERISPTRGNNMDHPAYTFASITKKPTAYLPMAMSLTALTLVLVAVARYGIVRGGDEGAVAHLWQLLMGLQLPLILFFLIRWLPRAPRPTLRILGLQLAAMLPSLAAVFFLT